MTFSLGSWFHWGPFRPFNAITDQWGRLEFFVCISIQSLHLIFACAAKVAPVALQYFFSVKWSCVKTVTIITEVFSRGFFFSIFFWAVRGRLVKCYLAHLGSYRVVKRNVGVRTQKHSIPPSLLPYTKVSPGCQAAKKSQKIAKSPWVNLAHPWDFSCIQVYFKEVRCSILSFMGHTMPISPP